MATLIQKLGVKMGGGRRREEGWSSNLIQNVTVGEGEVL